MQPCRIIFATSNPHKVEEVRAILAPLGISVHGVKSAVRRNRLKRIVREFYRHHRAFITWCRAAAIPPGTGMDVVLAIRSGFVPDSPQEIERVVREAVEKRPQAPRLPGEKKAGSKKASAERKKS